LTGRIANSYTDHFLRAGFRAGFLVDAGFAALGIVAALALLSGARRVARGAAGSTGETGLAPGKEVQVLSQGPLRR
jgi:hypothetical protein